MDDESEPSRDVTRVPTDADLVSMARDSTLVPFSNSSVPAAKRRE